MTSCKITQVNTAANYVVSFSTKLKKSKLSFQLAADFQKRADSKFTSCKFPVAESMINNLIICLIQNENSQETKLEVWMFSRLWSVLNKQCQRRPIPPSFHFQRVFIQNRMKNQIAFRNSGDRKFWWNWEVGNDYSISDIGHKNKNQHFKKLTFKRAKYFWAVNRQRAHEELSHTNLFQRQHNQRCNASQAMPRTVWKSFSRSWNNGKQLQIVIWIHCNHDLQLFFVILTAEISSTNILWCYSSWSLSFDPIVGISYHQYNSWTENWNQYNNQTKGMYSNASLSQ